MSAKLELGIGELVQGDPGRDAIHIAVAPVEAQWELGPGRPVTLNPAGKAIGCSYEKAVGIVDPFLRGQVSPGQKFWLFLKPNTITSLRHDWTHPNFPDHSNASPNRKNIAKSRIQAFADSLGISYDRLMRAADAYVDDEEYLFEGGRFEGSRHAFNFLV